MFHLGLAWNGWRDGGWVSGSGWHILRGLRCTEFVFGIHANVLEVGATWATTPAKAGSYKRKEKHLVCGNYAEAAIQQIFIFNVTEAGSPQDHPTCITPK